MIITVLHRPKPGDLYPLFRLQQDMVHQLGLKATILAIWPIMNEERIVDDMLGFRRKHGDEIGLFFGDLACPEFTETTGHVQNAFWLYSAEDKRRIAGTLLERFERCFGGPPRSVAGFCLDASSLRIIKEMCPAVETACACCFEEGVPTFHGTNNSWYLFNEGGPWGPWYPSKSHTLRPALSEEDSAGVVAVPHLARDMALSYESRNDFFSSHPPNVLRGKGNDGDECPYSLNLIDEYRRQERYNNGFSYMNLFVSPNWLGHSVNFEETPEVAQKLYRESLQYLAELRDVGQVTDMHLGEFGRWYRNNQPIIHSDVCLAREILFGSGKDYVWYINPHLRILIDPAQGGSIGDLRAYVDDIDGATGPDTPQLADASYPYLIQSQRRTGLANHAFDGARTTLRVWHGDDFQDLAYCRCRCAAVDRDGDAVTVRLTPATVSFQEGVSATVETSYCFPGDARVIVERRLVGGEETFRLEEYVKGCYGATEYPEDMHGVMLSVHGDNTAELTYEYANRKLVTSNANAVRACVPQVNTDLSLATLDGPACEGRAEEGFLFSPFFTLTLSRNVKPGETMRSCLSVAKIH